MGYPFRKNEGRAIDAETEHREAGVTTVGPEDRTTCHTGFFLGLEIYRICLSDFGLAWEG